MTDIEMGIAALTAAKAERAQMRTRLKAAGTALARAQDVAKQRADRRKVAERTATDSETQAAHELAAAITSEESAEITAETSGEAAAELVTARHGAAVAAAALEVVRQAHSDANAALATAEEAVVDTAKQILDAKADELAAGVMAAMDEAIKLGNELQRYIPDYLLTPVNVARRPVSASVRAAIDRLPRMDELNTPLNQLHGRVSSGDAWARKLKALVADEVSEAAAV
jgi:hypothetical protein